MDKDDFDTVTKAKWYIVEETMFEVWTDAEGGGDFVFECYEKELAEYIVKIHNENI